MVAGACSLIPTDDQPRALTPLPEPEEREDSSTDTALAATNNGTMVCVFLWDRVGGDGDGALYPQRVSGAVNDTADARLRALVALDNEDLDGVVEADGSRQASDIQTYVRPELRVVSVRQGGDGIFVVTLSEELDQVQTEQLVRLYAQLVYTATVGEPTTRVEFKKENLESETLDETVDAIIPPNQEWTDPVTRSDYSDFAPDRADSEACESRDAVDESTTSAGEDPTDDTTTTAAPAGAAAAELDAPTGGSDVTTATGDEPARAGAVPTTDTAGPGSTTTIEDGAVTTTTVEETSTTVG
jgi:spore germination protein GerM